jgi:hypothetical protein
MVDDVGRTLRAGLSSFGSSLLRSLAALRFNPLRAVPTWQHEWEPVEMWSETTNARTGEVLGRSVRRTKICVHCGHTHVFREMPCTRRRNGA